MLLTVLFALLLTLTASAGTLNEEKSAEFGLNQASPGAMAKYQLGTQLVANDVRVIKGTYDYAVLGGANGTYNLRGSDGKPVYLPNKAVVLDCIIDVQTPGTTSGAATIAIGANTASDLKVATGAASYTGRVACTPVGTAATAVKITADRPLTATIASQPVTAGKFVVIVQYVLSE